MSGRAKFQYGKEGFDPTDPAVKRALDGIKEQISRLRIAGLSDAVARVTAEIATHGTDVGTRHMVARQIVGTEIARQKASKYRQALQDSGFTKMTMHVEEGRVRELRRVVIAEAQRMGIRVRAAETGITADTSFPIIDEVAPISPAERVNVPNVQRAPEYNRDSVPDHPSLGSQEPLGHNATSNQVRRMQYLARERGIEVPKGAMESKATASAWISAHEMGRN
jgi:hypothetical protein